MMTFTPGRSPLEVRLDVARATPGPGSRPGVSISARVSVIGIEILEVAVHLAPTLQGQAERRTPCSVSVS
jgi:hypothetical protein